MKRKIYVMQGETPSEWCNVQPLGPFKSEVEARRAIRDDIANDLHECEALSPGTIGGYCSPYHLVEYIKGFEPLLKVDVSISLPNAEVSDASPRATNNTEG